MPTVTKEAKIRSAAFKEKVANLDLSPRILGKIFGLGGRSEETTIRRKLREESEKSFRRPTMSDILALGLLELLKDEGYNLETIKFDSNENVIGIEKLR